MRSQIVRFGEIGLGQPVAVPNHLFQMNPCYKSITILVKAHKALLC